MKINEKKFGTTSSGEDVFLYTINCSNGTSVKLCNIGAGIVSICVPDKNNVIKDVVPVYDDLLSYIGDGPCFGKTPGRIANRIANGKFVMDGKEYNLPINNGPNHNHGGNNGFANRVWKSKIDGDKVVFNLFAPDGDDGYPGDIKAEVAYYWDSANKKLSIDLSATTSSKTIVNLTNHCYFNLKGEGNGSILDHNLFLDADYYLPTDSTLIPTGELRFVDGTPMDFRNNEVIGKRINDIFPALEYGKGYDACWSVNDFNNNIKKVASLSSDLSGIQLNVYSNQPGVIVYTGNWLSGCPVGKNGHIYNDNDGVAIECQKYPDAPNKPMFPSVELLKNDTFVNNIVFEFRVFE